MGIVSIKREFEDGNGKPVRILLQSLAQGIPPHGVASVCAGGG